MRRSAQSKTHSANSLEWIYSGTKKTLVSLVSHLFLQFERLSGTKTNKKIPRDIRGKRDFGTKRGSTALMHQYWEPIHTWGLGFHHEVHIASGRNTPQVLHSRYESREVQLKVQRVPRLGTAHSSETDEISSYPQYTWPYNATLPGLSWCIKSHFFHFPKWKMEHI